MAYDWISDAPHCPLCGQAHELAIQVQLTSDPTQRWVHVGDSFVLELAGLILVRSPPPGEPVTVLDKGLVCSVRHEELWSELTFAEDQLKSIQLVKLTTDVVNSLNYLPGSSSTLWDSVRRWLFLGDWAETYATRDRVRELRMKLLLREPLAARNRHEVALFLRMIECEPLGPLTRDEGGWRQRCVNEFKDEIDLRVILADESETIELLGGPSKIIAPEAFRRFADVAVAGVPGYPDDLPPEARALAKRELEEAIIYLEQLAAFIPQDAAGVPADALWGDQAREDLDAAPHRYDRGHIASTIDRWRRDPLLAPPRSLTARSAEEAAAFMDLHRCPRCGEATPQLQSRVVSGPSGLLSIYEGTCPRCELPRRFEMHLSDELPPASTDTEIAFGNGRSTMLDPMQFVAAAAAYAQRGGTYALAMARGALAEAGKFIADDETEIPRAAITSRMGWALYDAEPSIVLATQLEELRDRVVELQAL